MISSDFFRLPQELIISFGEALRLQVSPETEPRSGFPKESQYL